MVCIIVSWQKCISLAGNFCKNRINGFGLLNLRKTRIRMKARCVLRDIAGKNFIGSGSHVNRKEAI